MLIHHVDAFSLLAKIEDEPGTVIYCDPPYFDIGCRYMHDFRDSDHGRLATVLRKFRRARVVLSYYEHERLPELYSGWTKVNLHRHKNLHVQNRRGASKSIAPEVLLLNGPRLGERKLFA